MTAFSLESLTSDKVAWKCPVDDGLPGHVYRDAVELVHDRAPDLPVLQLLNSLTVPDIQ